MPNIREGRQRYPTPFLPRQVYIGLLENQPVLPVSHYTMTKQLLVMRHAKSSWNQVGLSDYQRPLNERGLSDAPRMAEFVRQQNCLPNLIASSTAVRARQTTELFVAACPDQSISLLWVDEFYHAPPRVYLNYLTTLESDNLDTVMLVGHNPGLEELVAGLAGQSHHFPTAAIAHFQVDISVWSEFTASVCELVSLWRPKEVL